MDGSLRSGNAGSSSWTTIAHFEVTDYPQGYAWGMNARRFQAIHASGVSCTVYDARHGVVCETRVGTWVNRPSHGDGRDAVM